MSRDAATTAVLAGLRHRLRDTVRAALGGHDGPVALIDFPNHTNVGDQAIWAGERALLAELGIDVAYMADHASWSPRTLRRRLPRGPVLLHGGGNFGDVWPAFQAFREHVLADVRDRRAVMLPQTIHFAGEAALGAARAAVAAHPDCVLLVRDEQSLTLAREHFPSAGPRLCPDSALMLELARPAAPDVDVVYLSRTDGERARAGAGDALGVAALDWTGHRAGEPGWTAEYARLHSLTWTWGRRGRRRPRIAPLTYPLVARGYDRLTRERVACGVGMLSRGSVVVTDRLHAHILSLLLGIPHVVVDTGYGKVDRFIAAWTAGSPLVHRSPSWPAAAGAAAGLVATG